ncbi:hypothetical protein [Ferrovibrio sp.]|uniref:hypothetical protein n=1 Tax=Ferrovibrio sp. TaxID=1917215 RepID=UPI0035B3DEDD
MARAKALAMAGAAGITPLSPMPRTPRRAISAAEHAQALDRLDTLRAKLDRIVSDYDAMLSLSSTGEAPRGLDSTGDPIFNIGWTALHMPSITLPVLYGANGLPIGLQLAGARYEEDRLIGAALELEAYFQRRPITS